MKKIILCISTVLLTMVCYGQMMTDLVHLKNGSIIKGNVYEQTDDLIKVTAKDGSILVYPSSDVVKISQEVNAEIKYLNAKGPYPGYRGFFDFGRNFGLTNSWSISTAHGYQADKHCFMGFGVGVDLLKTILKKSSYSEGTELRPVIPIFFNIRVDMIDNSITPFFDLRAGYSIDTKTQTLKEVQYQGAFLAPSMGVRVVLEETVAFNLSVGYIIRQTTIGDVKSFSNGDFTIKVGFDFGPKPKNK